MPAPDPDARAPKPYADQGARLKKAREDKGIEQADLARRVGVEPTSFWRYEVGERNPGRRRWDLIAKELGMPVHYFTHGIEPAKAMTPGEALECVEYKLGLEEPQKARLRALLKKYKHHRIDKDYLEAAAELVRYPNVSDETVHATAVTSSTHAHAKHGNVRKMRGPARESERAPKAAPRRSK